MEPQKYPAEAPGRDRHVEAVKRKLEERFAWLA